VPTQSGEILTGNPNGTQAWTPQFLGLQIFFDTSTTLPTALGQSTFTASNDFLNVGLGIGPISAISISAAGGGYTTATGLATAGGSGTGATVNITAVSGAVTLAGIAANGSGYAVGDVLTIVQSGASLGTVTVTNISATASFVPSGAANTGLVLGLSTYQTTAGALWYSGGHVSFYDGSAARQLFDPTSAVALATGSTAVTQATGDKSTDVATDAFVANSISAIVFPASGIQPVQATASFWASALYEYLINASSGINVTLPPAMGASGPIGIRNLSANQIDLVPQNALTTIETAMGTSNTAGHQIKCTGAACSGTLYSLANGWFWQPLSGTWTDDGAVTGGTPTFVQSPTYCSDSWGPGCTSKSFSSNVTAGDTLYVFATGFTGTTNTSVTIADTLGNTFYQVMFAPQTCSGGSCATANQTTGLWVAYQAKGGADTVTVTWGAGASNVFGSGLGIAEFANVSRTNGTAAFAASASGTTATSPSLTTTNANDLVIGILGGGETHGGSTAPTVGSGYTLLGSAGYTGGNGWEYKIISSSGSQTATFGIASNTAWDAGIAAFANY
jgi:hypothetical protein